MSSRQEIRYTLNVRAAQGRSSKTLLTDHQPGDGEAPGQSIPRITRLMALAIRFEGLLREGTLRDYAELARLGRVSRARITQIMKLLDLAPDIQEQILFWRCAKGINERNLRPVASRINWNEQRNLFQKMQGATAAVCRTRSEASSSPAFPR